MQAETEVIPSEHESFKWLLEALCDELVEVHGDPANEDASWIRVVTDSRIVRAGDVFVALSGERTDGHRYLLQAAESGAFCLVVEHVETGLNVPQLVVENSRRAYGLIARAWRRRFGIALTAVGGSNGKTTTTQMMKAILAAHWGVQNIHATEGNFNNDVGVPHTLLGLHCGCRAAVVEAGMNHRGEMARLADWIRPTVVLMTNAQREHQAYLETVELKRHYTIVIVTHNMQQAARISDRTAFFLLGELVEVGPTAQIFSAPQDKRTEDYISGRFG